MKDPRIVRVRLSVPTAIQLYDLQDRLELNQPSKVVDWLINVANHEINELPFLQMPSENFSQYFQSMMNVSYQSGNLEAVNHRDQTESHAKDDPCLLRIDCRSRIPKIVSHSFYWAKEHHQSNVNFSGINPTKVPLKLLNSSTMGNEYSDPAALGEFSATCQNCN
ncbi:hypothetical protein L2E82_31636 [Cichorium intybus]|uniref:Uncharacterized protein n=1 Tax=Cichorium intybus TaxID=13427 RepID=A0ACB9BFA3_CICIN|nr:hypothetical protein L2E82_31636 [Cichorium intybus]